MSATLPPPRKPLLPEDVLDAPSQRLWLFSAFVLVQAYKLSDVFFPSPSLGAELAPLVNWTLYKWIAADVLFVAVVRTLRVPRVDWSWMRGLLLMTAALLGVDWLLFGQWKFLSALILPGFVKALFASYVSTAEHSVRLSHVVGNQKSHLGGQYTVHILAVSTAQLNPASSSYCIPPSVSHVEPIHIPLIFNNTVPFGLNYTITSLGADPSTATSHSILASALIHPASEKSTAEEAMDDLDEWAFGALVPKPSSSPAALRHRLIKGPSESDVDPLHLSHTQSLYYLPIAQTGIVRLSAAWDSKGLPVRIRRQRPTVETGDGDVRILPCPRAGFAASEAEIHSCLSPTTFETRSLDLRVAGWQPLSVKWRVGSEKSSTIEGIASSHSTTGDDVIFVPQNVSLSHEGRQTISLDSVSDGAGNIAYFESESKSLLKGTRADRTFVTHLPPEIAFGGTCGRGDDVKMLEGKKANIELKLSRLQSSTDRKDKQWTVRLKFTPPGGGKGGWERDEMVQKSQIGLEVTAPGTYEILSVKDRWCQGAVLVPSTCTVVVQPLPTIETSFAPIVDVCGREVGSTATLLFTGAPPFAVSYSLTHLPSRRTTNHVERFSQSRATLRLEPGPGEWEYRFNRLRDAVYTDFLSLPSDKASVNRQEVQLISGAEWKGKERLVKSCDGSTIPVEVTLKGQAPWELEYAVVGASPEVIKNIKTANYAFEVPIPSHIAQRGGEFSLSLVSVKDSLGCRRPLSAQDLVIDVRRTKPTARFHGGGGARKLTIRENEAASIPLRLTGEGPWTITYGVPPPLSNPNARPSIITFDAKSPNVDINIPNPIPGIYTLVSVRDKFCPGDVSEPEWEIATLPRPTLQFATGAGELVRNGSLVRPGVCENAVDNFSLTFDGKAPFKATYDLLKGGSHSSERLSRSLQTIRPQAELTLFTGLAGHHVYHFTGVADSLYASPEVSGLLPPVGGRNGLLRLEQDVYPLPSARFKSRPTTAGFCINDKLASKTKDDLVIHFEGFPPFAVELEVREEGHRNAQRFDLKDIKQKDWAVNLAFTLNSPTPHVITIRKVVDARGCERLLDHESTARSTVINVAETATISPILPQTDHCVGDMLDFVVQGAPPFTVTYEFAKEVHVVPGVLSRFSRLAATPGEFKIVSVGHGHDQCRPNNVGLVKHVYALPTARVSHGDNIYVDLREGDQTEIVFDFTGEPPFAFTYSRRHPQDRSKDRTILETHTVTGIMEYSYSIFTSQEGTWTVSFVSDKHCSYPSSTQARRLEK